MPEKAKIMAVHGKMPEQTRSSLPGKVLFLVAAPIQRRSRKTTVRQSIGYLEKNIEN
jgi:hypothetical protein